MTSAATASSATALFDAGVLGVLTVVSPSTAFTLFLRSTRIRWAVFVPIPLTATREFSSLSAIARTSSDGDREERIIRAVLGPTPGTVVSIKNSSRSSIPAKPKSTWASSRMIS